MGNPYKAQFTDDNSKIRIDGAVTFTDPNNQPGGGGTQPENLRALLVSVGFADIAAVYDTDKAWGDLTLFTPDTGIWILDIIPMIRKSFDASDIDPNLLYGSTEWPFDNSTPASAAGGFMIDGSSPQVVPLHKSSTPDAVGTDIILNIAYGASNPYKGWLAQGGTPIIVASSQAIVGRFVCGNGTGPYTAPTVGLIDLIFIVATPVAP